MTTGALGLVLVAAFAHAGWNLLAKTAGGGAAFVWLCAVAGAAYRDGDLSLVYPLARGTGPLLATVAAIAVLGERPGLLALAGALIIVLAVLSLAGDPRRLAARHGGAAVGFALLTGVAIAAYTLWDKQAVGPQGLSPVVYLWGSTLVNALVLSPWALRRRAALAGTWSAHRRQVLAVGALSPLAYLLVLFALPRPGQRGGTRP